MNSDSALLLSLYRDARELPTAEFQQSAIQLVRPVLRFESMIWGAGYLTDALDTTSLVPIRAASFEIDPAAFAYWKSINRADKVIPTTLKSPWTTINFHAPTLFASKEDSVMRDYTRKFGRENNLATVLADPDAPLIEWCSFYRPYANDRYSEADRERCQMLVRHLSEALKVNQMAQDSGAIFAGKKDDGEFAALVDNTGNVLSAQHGFLEACRRQWPEFDGRRIPPAVLRQLTGAGDGCYRGRTVKLRSRAMADYLWVTSKAPETAEGLPPRRMDVAVLFARGHSTKGIARMLGISPSTVRNQLAASYLGLGVSSRSELQAAILQTEIQGSNR